MTIELLQVPGCPNVAGARQTLESCLQQLGLDLPIAERVGDFPSPSILVDGVDVMGKHEVSGAACRLDLPTEDRILAALCDTAHPTRSPWPLPVSELNATSTPPGGTPVASTNQRFASRPCSS
jgi:hypothetical protein